MMPFDLDHPWCSSLWSLRFLMADFWVRLDGAVDGLVGDCSRGSGDGTDGAHGDGRAPVVWRWVWDPGVPSVLLLSLALGESKR
jgi:hypothetical protein